MEKHIRCQIVCVFVFHIRSLSKIHPYITYKAARSIAVRLFCQVLTTAMTFCRDCPPNRLNVYRQCKMLLQELSWNAKKQITSLPFLGSFIGFLSRNGSATKFSLATYRSVHDNTPLYLSDLLQKHNPSRLLRSASRSLLDVPGTKDSKIKRYGLRAFRYVAPSLWNVLPESIKEKDSIQSFRSSVKTHFFT